jgi:hypothetical protein
METFKYKGYTFIPFRKLTKKESKLNLSLPLETDFEIDLRKYDNNYNYKEFYEASGKSEMDVFYCVETGKGYIPCENELFILNDGYEYNEYEQLHNAFVKKSIKIEELKMRIEKLEKVYIVLKNENLLKTCSDVSERIDELKKEIEQLKK